MFSFFKKRALIKQYKNYNILQLLNKIGLGLHKSDPYVDFSILHNEPNNEWTLFYLDTKRDHKFQFTYFYNEHKQKVLKECFCYNEDLERIHIYSYNNSEINMNPVHQFMRNNAESIILKHIFKNSLILLK